MAPSSVASVFLCLLLLLFPASHGASSHANYKLGSGQFFYRTPGKSSGNAQQASTVPPATTCSSSIATGLDNNKLPVVHRQSPCSPLHGLPSQTPADILRRDTSRIWRRFSSQTSSVVAAPAPSPMASSIKFFPWDPSIQPVVLDHSVFVNYGTPEQRFPVYLDTITGYSQLLCKPCASGSNDPSAFNTSRSLTFTQVPCGSPDCPMNCSNGSVCQLVDQLDKTIIWGTFSRDVYTVSLSMVIDDFRFVCLGAPAIAVTDDKEEQPQVGTLDLSRDRNSLPSRLSPSSTPAFSYCLPPSPSSEGFLYLDGNATRIRDDNNTVHASLVSHEGEPEWASAYFIELVGMSLGGADLPIPADAFGNNGSILDVGSTYTMLTPTAYEPLRDAFRKEMSVYNCSLPGTMFDAGFDTCYNFTALDELFIPFLRLKFGNGENLLIDWDQLLYYKDPLFAPFTVACLAFSTWNTSDGDGGAPPFSVIGTYQLSSTEVVYDVSGGKVGFIPDSC